MIKIGDFSKIAKISIRMLRHYDQIDLLKPAYIDPSSGYRGYLMDQLPRLSRIIFLKELGFSLTEVKELIDNNITIEEMKTMLSKRQTQLMSEIAIASYNLNSISNRLEMIENEGKLPLYDISIKKTAEFTVASIRRIVPRIEEIGRYCFEMYSDLYKCLESFNLSPSGPEMTFYHNDEYVETNLDMEASIVIDASCLDWVKLDGSADSLQIRTLKQEETVASLIYEGPFEGLEVGFIELIKWVAINDWEISGAAREIHLLGKAHGESINNKNIAELQIPIIKARK